MFHVKVHVNNYIYCMARRRRTTCCACGKSLEDNRIGKNAYCKSCHAAWMRENRPSHHDLSEYEKYRVTARAMVHIYVRRGCITKSPCVICGTVKVEAHHRDYSKPLDVIWVCSPCHKKIHKGEISVVLIDSIQPSPVTLKYNKKAKNTK